MEEERGTDWLNEEFLKNALSMQHDEMVIKNYTVRSALGKGNNYTSDILRVTVTYCTSGTPATSERKQNLIIKNPIMSGTVHNAMFKIGIIQREFKIYYEFLPNLLKIFDETEVMLVKCLPTTKENVLVMEDLNDIGYKMVDRTEQLDMDHAILVLKKLGQFHAATVKLAECKPDVIKKYGGELLFDKNRKMGDDAFRLIDSVLGESQLRFLAEEIETWPESNKYTGKIRKIMNGVWDIQYKIYDRDEAGFNVFRHNDLWSSNMLFKYDSDGRPPTAVKFLDLQCVTYGDPVFDLHYFIYSSLRYDIAVNKTDQLIDIYHNYLCKYLEKYRCEKRLSKENLKASFQEKEIFGFLTCCRILLFVLAEKDNIIDFSEDERTKDENMLKAYLKSPKFRETFPKYLDYFSNKQWFKNI